MKRRTRGAMWLAIGLGLAVPAGARAQAPSNDVAATALFDEGRRLMAAHDYATACPKLAESQRLSPSGGTLLNLAECYEKNGQTASAWAAWKDAAGRANAAGKADVEKRASDRATVLEPNLAKLTVTLGAGSDVPGLEVKRDGVAVGHAEFGTALPVDPGTHTVEASAPGKQPWSGKVDVAAKQKDAIVTVMLVDAPAPPPPPPPPNAAGTGTPPPNPPPPPPAPQAETSSWSTQKTIAVVAGGVGVVGVAVGSIFGLRAKSKNDEALQPQNCPTSSQCTQNGLDLTNDAKSAASLSTIGFVAGGVLVAAGVVLWVTAPSPKSQTGIRLAPAVAPSFGGLSLDTAF